jgi:hypothetical protein
MNKPVVLVGIGEMGGVFGRALLRAGRPVYPVTRGQSMAELATQLPRPELVLLAVGEKDISRVLGDVPDTWRDRLGLLQNELLPGDWDGIPDPTVISVWFEKKPGQDAKVIIPSPVYGPHGGLLADALQGIGIPARVLDSPRQLLFELVVKNLYILTSNIAGLRTGGTVDELWRQHRPFARQVAGEVIAIQQALTGETLESELLIVAMAEAFAADPAHQCMGRSAPARLARALEHSRRFALRTPVLTELQAELD